MELVIIALIAVEVVIVSDLLRVLS
jgi:hypothetical protein